MHLETIWKPSRTPAPCLVHAKTVFHEIGPWCQKGWASEEKGELKVLQELGATGRDLTA